MDWVESKSIWGLRPEFAERSPAALRVVPTAPDSDRVYLQCFVECDIYTLALALALALAFISSMEDVYDSFFLGVAHFLGASQDIGLHLLDERTIAEDCSGIFSLDY